MHVEEAVERDRPWEAEHAAARPLGRLHRHRADHDRHARAVDPGIGTDTLYDVGVGGFRCGDAQAVAGPRGGLQPYGGPVSEEFRPEHAQDRVRFGFFRDDKRRGRVGFVALLSADVFSVNGGYKLLLRGSGLDV